MSLLQSFEAGSYEFDSCRDLLLEVETVRRLGSLVLGHPGGRAALLRDLADLLVGRYRLQGALLVTRGDDGLQVLDPTTGTTRSLPDGLGETYDELVASARVHALERVGAERPEHRLPAALAAASAAVLPLVAAGRPLGLLVLVSGRLGTFQADTAARLDVLAPLVSQALVAPAEGRGDVGYDLAAELFAA